MVEAEVLFACLPVTDLTVATQWYGNLFGRSPDIVPNEDEVMWRVTDGAWCYVPRDPERAGHTVVTMSVADLTGTLADLAARGITGDAVEPVGDAGHKAVILDPDRNSISLVEVNARGD
jgi:predicted enzyme related to lactoylglutathione lyase